MANIITRRMLIYQKQAYAPTITITIVRKNGTTDTLDENHILNCNWTRCVASEGVGDFTLTINDNSGAYTSAYSGGETITIYADTLGGTVVRFKGYVDRVENSFKDDYGSTVMLTGTQLASELLDIHVTDSYENIEGATVISALATEYAPTFTVSSTVTGALVTVNFVDTPFWDCVVEIASKMGCDAYVDESKVIHLFKRDSVLNEIEAVVFDDNLKELTGLGKDTTEVKNKVRVTGEDDQGLPIIYTSEDATSQSKYRVKERRTVMKDANTMTDVKNMADSDMSISKETEPKGEITSFWVLNLNPGEQMWISSGTHKVHQPYTISKFTHSWNSGDTETNCSVRFASKSLAKMLKDRVDRERRLTKTDNVLDMDYSFNIGFDSSGDLIGSGFQISNGEVRLGSGVNSATGTTLPKRYGAVSSLSQCVLKVAGEDIGDCKFWYSTQSGNPGTFVEITANSDTLSTVTTTGNNVAIKIQIMSSDVNPTPVIKSLAFLFTGT